MKKNPKVSVIMSAYNENVDEFSSAVDSILIQSFTDFEFIIIIDNPENSELLRIAESYKLRDERIRLILNEKNIGLALSLNIGLEHAKGDFIARMDADDISDKDRFQIQMNQFCKYPTIDILSTNCFYINENNEIIGKKSKIPTSEDAIKKILPIGSSIIHPSVIGKKSVFLEVGGYRKLDTAEDYDLWLRMLSAGKIIKSIPDYLLYYRIRENSMTKGNVYRQIKTDIYIREKFNRRIRGEIDNYSEIEYKRFIGNQKQKKIFDHYYKRFLRGIDEIKVNKFSILGYCYLISSVIMNNLIRYMFIMLVRYKVMVKKLCGE